MFADSSPRRDNHVFRLLGWLASARRPLKWHEIQGAVSIDLDKEDIDWNRRKLREDSKELCGALVEIKADGTVELVHHTARL